MYFHMTLSFLGQLLDEISILWLLASGYSVWLPRCYFPKFIQGSRYYFSCLVITTTMISTFLTFVKPTVNAYALNSIAIHILYIVHKEYKNFGVSCPPCIRIGCEAEKDLESLFLLPPGRTNRTRNGDLRHLIEVSVILWATALTSWISDRVLCSFWQRIHFSYLHSIWHVLISITFPYGMATMALMDANYEMPGQTLKVHYWPRDSWFIGLPYVEIQDNDKSC
ncbi:alkaline ceramidase 1 isoform X1 [Mesocricetus auratus]|nr:alkaline ceramidase 1 isoform X1 [Mesocricetus auratus]